MGTAGRRRRRDHHRGRGQGRRRARRAGSSTSSRRRSTNQRRRDRLHRHLDQHRAMSLTMESPSCKVTPGPLPDRTATRARRATSTRSTSTTSSPRSVGLPGRILHGLWTMAQVARAQAEAAGGPRALQAARRSSSAAWASRSRRSRSPRRVQGRRGRRGDVDTEAEQDGRRIIRNGRRAEVATPPLLRIERVLTPRQELLLGKVVDGFAATGQPVGSKALAADPDVDCRPVDDPQRARRARGAGAARAPAHLRGARADRRGLPLLRRPACCRARARRRSRRARSS